MPVGLPAPVMSAVRPSSEKRGGVIAGRLSPSTVRPDECASRLDSPYRMHTRSTNGRWLDLVAEPERRVETKLGLGESAQDCDVQRHAVRGTTTNLETSHLGAGIFKFGNGPTRQGWIGGALLDEASGAGERGGQGCHLRASPRIATGFVELDERGVALIEGLGSGLRFWGRTHPEQVTGKLTPVGPSSMPTSGSWSAAVEPPSNPD